jgi:hypothetical protein
LQGLKIEPSPITQPLLSASKHSIPISGLVNIKVDIGGHERQHPFLYVPDFSKEVLLGVDAFDDFGINMHFPSRSLVTEQGIPVKFSITKEYEQLVNYVRAKKTTVVPPNTMKIIRCTHNINEPIEVAVLEQSDTWKHQRCYVGRTGVKIEPSKEVFAVVMNRTKKPITIWRNRRVATIEEVSVCHDQNGEVFTITSEDAAKLIHQGPEINNVNTQENNPLKNAKLNIGSKLTEEQLQQLNELITKHHRVFEKPTKLGVTPVVHRIPLTADKVVKQSQYRLSKAEQEEVDKQAQDMASKGIIERSNSPWNSPVILVKKKDGTFRFCVDFRALNAITKQDAYPLPNISDYLDALGKAKYFTVMDLISGYWQILLDSADREKTAFSTRNGHWQFNVMPFGLSGAPATFQRAMDVLLSGCLWHFALVYLDDIIVFSNTWEEHLKHLDEVLTRLNKSNFKVKLEKCQFACETVKFLGHVISRDGIHPDPDKIAKIKDTPAPKNVTSLQRFLGLCNYYRKFVKDFAEIARPLYDLVGSTKTWNWTSECDAAFNNLKEALTSEPVMVTFPNYSHDFVLETDASEMAIGAVLNQVIDGEKKVIAYYSQVLDKHQRNYSITEKECLAVVKGIHHFRHYLFGRKFTVITDHECLVWLKTLKEPHGRLARWLLRLQEYQFTIQYRRGKENFAADALTREPVVQEVMGIFDDFNLAAEQREDEELKLIIDYLETEKLPNDEYLRTKLIALKEHYALDENGVLLHIERLSTKQSAFQIAIPWHLRSVILRQCHSDSTAGHFGFQRTFHLVRAKYYWDTMFRDVNNFVKICKRCQEGKLRRRKKIGYLKSIKATEPFEIIGMDFIGPLKESRRGKKFILVITDYFTKWPEAFALKDSTAELVAEVLMKKFIPRHGVPMKILTDRGSQFTSKLLKELFRLMKIKKMETTAYHPQCDGLVERMNGTLKQLLQMHCDTEKRDWDDWIPLALFAYRRTKHPVTGHSPFFLVHGREPNVPIDTIINMKIDENVNLPRYTRDLILRLQEAFKSADAQINKKKEEQQEQYNRRREDEEFSVGDWILVERIAKPGDDKFKQPFEGPFKIRKKLSALNYRLEDIHGNKIDKTFNIVQLKKVNFNDISSWLKRDNSDSENDDGEDPRSESSSVSSDNQSVKSEQFDESSDEISSESDDVQASEEKEEVKDIRQEDPPEKLKRLYEILLDIQKVVQQQENFAVKAFQKQLTRDIFPTFIKNTKRKQYLKSVIDEASTKEKFRALLKKWIDNFSIEFHYEIESVASK